MKFLERGNGRRWQKLNGLFVAYLPSGFIKNHIIEGSQERSCRGFIESGQVIDSFVGDITTPIPDDITILLFRMGMMSPVIRVNEEQR